MPATIEQQCSWHFRTMGLIAVAVTQSIAAKMAAQSIESVSKDKDYAHLVV
jgi:hypothetical protein